MWQVTAPHFVAGIVTLDDRVIAAAPILYWTLGKDRTALRRYFANQGWDVRYVLLA